MEGKPGESKIFFSGYKAVIWPPGWGRASINLQLSSRMPA